MARWSGGGGPWRELRPEWIVDDIGRTSNADRDRRSRPGCRAGDREQKSAAAGAGEKVGNVERRTGGNRPAGCCRHHIQESAAAGENFAREGRCRDGGAVCGQVVEVSADPMVPNGSARCSAGLIGEIEAVVLCPEVKIFGVVASHAHALHVPQHEGVETAVRSDEKRVVAGKRVGGARVSIDTAIGRMQRRTRIHRNTWIERHVSGVAVCPLRQRAVFVGVRIRPDGATRCIRRGQRRRRRARSAYDVADAGPHVVADGPIVRDDERQPRLGPPNRVIRVLKLGPCDAGRGPIRVERDDALEEGAAVGSEQFAVRFRIGEHCENDVDLLWRDR